MHFDLQGILTILGTILGLIGTIGHLIPDPKAQKAADVADQVAALNKAVQDHITAPAATAHAAPSGTTQAKGADGKPLPGVFEGQ